MTKETVLVVCPGRGTYNKDELGYLGRHHADKADLIEQFDDQRRTAGRRSLRDLDGAERFVMAEHTRGDMASPLIYACAYADWLSIDRDRFDIVAVTGNSMGWYIALACAGAASAEDGFRIVDTMGALMQDALIGGQIIYPFIDNDWQEIPGRREELLSLTNDITDLHLSILLGGMILFGGTSDALARVERRLPTVQERFPMRLPNHAAFHTPLMAPIALQGQAALSPNLFAPPAIPLIDGRGHAWLPRATNTSSLRDYTLGHQVVEPYDFTAALRTGLREFAPNRVLVLGPGATLIGAVAQCLIADGWYGLHSKTDFTDRQAVDPVIVAMGSDRLRHFAVSAEGAI